MNFTTHQPQRQLTFALSANAASRCVGAGEWNLGMELNKAITIARRNPKQPGTWCRQSLREQRS